MKMDAARELITTDTRAKLSAVWIFVLLNVVFRDLHDLFRPGILQEMMSGVVNGVQLTQETLLLAGVVLEIPIAMVLLSRLLAYRVNRWANIIASVVTIPLLLISGPKDLDDVWFLAIEVITLLLLAWYTWRWRGIDPSPARAEAQ
jgi:hypothetical protein